MKLDTEEQYNFMGHLQSSTGIMYSGCSVHAFKNFFICLHFTCTCSVHAFNNFFYTSTLYIYTLQKNIAIERTKFSFSLVMELMRCGHIFPLYKEYSNDESYFIIYIYNWHNLKLQFKKWRQIVKYIYKQTFDA